jgi:hypothetical protein
MIFPPHLLYYLYYFLVVFLADYGPSSACVAIAALPGETDGDGNRCFRKRTGERKRDKRITERTKERRKGQENIKQKQKN